jgi:xylan 1,4-beta-xylosidase
VLTTASLRCRVALFVLLAAPSVPGSAQSPATYTNPVLPGDHPDPSVIRVGREYWATATTSQWAPVFPLLRSVDLVNWTLAGAVFDTPPAWSEGSYWAPEIAADRGQYFVYYTARRRNGPLCIAVATAMRPSGPYVDHGPLTCQEIGSIDAAPVTAEGGVRYLVWKEDGNSRHLPTPIWAQRLSPDGTRLVGERHQLLRNEAQWEGPLVEGPFILRRNGWIYMFYSAGACCGRTCDYRLGVARARRLLGPWERNPANPILTGNDAWKCPGHGTVVATAGGRTYLLYHAYRPGDFEYSGRQGLLDEVTWDEDGWPVVNGGRGPSATAAAPLGVPEKDPAPVGDEFTAPRLSPAWQWPWDHAPVRALRDGLLTLTVTHADAANAAGTVIARPTVAGDYVASTRLLTSTLENGGNAGIAAYGNGENALGMSVATGRVTLWRREKAVQSSLASVNLPTTGAVLLRMQASAGRRFRFSVSADEGRTWRALGDETEGGCLPPWDLGVRIALVAGGPAGTRARFDWLRVDTTR